MPNLGVTVAIFDDGRILLTRREDFEIWCLPGGQVDDGESLAEAAAREAFEETGLEIELTHLVGAYSRPKWWLGGLHSLLFAARPVGGRLRPQPSEVIEARYFAPDALPNDLLWSHRQWIEDAFAGWGGSLARSDPTPWPFDPNLSRQELYAMRDRSGLSRSAYYAQILEPAVGRLAEPSRLEVEGRRWPDR
jgi:ADP-ribose pyrophosphatase YjhB (NUDIX family)